MGHLCLFFEANFLSLEWCWFLISKETFWSVQGLWASIAFSNWHLNEVEDGCIAWASIAWMVASKRDSLCMEILRAKYKVWNDWLFKEPPKAAYPIWKAIEGVKNIIVKCQGACYLIGNGASINVWQDPWVPWIQGFKPHPKSANSDTNPLMVSQLIDQVSFMWNVSLIKDLFEPDSANAILSIHLLPTPRQAHMDSVPQWKILSQISLPHCNP